MTIDYSKYDGHTEEEWILGTHPANNGLHIVRPVLLGGRVRILPECEGGHVCIRNESDARLIADAPLLLARVKELEAENARMREGLRLIRDAVSGADHGISVGDGGTFTKMGDAMAGIEMRNRVKDRIGEILSELDEDKWDAT